MRNIFCMSLFNSALKLLIAMPGTTGLNCVVLFPWCFLLYRVLFTRCVSPETQRWILNIFTHFHSFIHSFSHCPVFLFDLNTSHWFQFSHHRETAVARDTQVCVYIYIYIYVCVCVCVCIYIYVCVCVCIYLYIYIYIYVCVCVWCVCVCVCVYLSISIYICVCVCVCVCIKCIYI